MVFEFVRISSKFGFDEVLGMQIVRWAMVFEFCFLVWILGIGFQGPCCLLGDLAVSGAEIMVPTCLLRFTLRILFFAIVW